MNILKKFRITQQTQVAGDNSVQIIGNNMVISTGKRQKHPQTFTCEDALFKFVDWLLTLKKGDVVTHIDGSKGKIIKMMLEEAKIAVAFLDSANKLNISTWYAGDIKRPTTA